MCGRFIFSANDSMERLERTMKEYFPTVTGLDQYSMINRDIYPSQDFPVITDSLGNAKVVPMKWGYPPASQKSKSLLINARAETAEEKYTFRYDFEYRRCLIPATGFYEWSKEKQKYLFTDPQRLLFIGGLYTKPREEEGKKIQNFVILTKSPDEIVSRVHNRMPVLVEPDQIRDWLRREDQAKRIIGDYQAKLIEQNL